MKLKFSYFFIFCCLLCSHFSFANDIENLLIYSDEQKVYIPYLKNIDQTNTLSFQIENEHFNRFLVINSKHKCYIFLNNSLYSSISQNENFSLFISKNVFKKNDFITIYSEDLLDDISITIQNHKKILILKEQESFSKLSFNEIQNIHKSFSYSYIIGIIILFISLAITKSFNLHTVVFSLNNNASTNSNFQRQNSKSNFSQIELLAITFLIFSYFSIIYFTYKHSSFYNLKMKETADFLIFFAIFSSKLIGIKIILHFVLGYFLKIQSFTVSVISETYKVLALVMFLVTIFLLLSLTPYYTLVYLNFQFRWILAYILFAFLFIREFYLMLFKFGFNKNYLFAYICICDLYPFVYILKLT